MPSSVFVLITNDGKQDKMLMATDLLNRRLTAVKNAYYDKYEI